MKSKATSPKSEALFPSNDETFRLLFENHPIPMWIYELKTLSFLEVNDAAVEKYGYTRDEFLALTIRDIRSAEDVTRLLKNVKRERPVIQHSGEWRHRLKNGQNIDVEITSHTLEFKGRKAALVTAQDVTERKQAEEALSASNAELRALFASMQDVVLVINRDGVYRKIAPTNLSLLYKSSEELLGKNLREVFPVEQTQTFIGTIQQVLETRQTARIEYELTIGEHVVWFSASISLMDEDSTLWVVRDVTERKQAEKELKRQLQELTLLQAVSDHAANATSEDDLLAQVTSLIGKTFYPVNFGFLLISEDGTSLLMHSSYRGVTLENIQQKIPLLVGAVGHVVTSGRPLRLADVRNEENYLEVNPTTRSELCVPMIIGTRVLGVINTESQEVDAFNEEDERLLSTLAGQTANALDRIRSAASEHRRRVEAETLREAAASLTTSLELNQVLDNLLVQLAQVIPYESTAVYLKENNILWLVAGKGAVPETLIGQGISADNALFNEMLKIHRPLILADAQSDARMEHFGDISKIRGWMGVPLIARGEIIGQLSVDSSIVGMYNETHAKLAQAFANQAATAIENARLFEETRQRLTELELLYESGLTLSQLLSPKEIGQKIIDLLERKLDWHHTAIRLYHPQDETLELLAFHQPNITSEAERFAVEARFNSMVAHTGQGLSGWAVQHDENVRASNLINDTRYAETFPGLQSGLYVPIKLGERVIGVISIESEQAEMFSAADERLTTTLANQAAIALENARLFEESGRRSREFASLYETSKALSAVHNLDTLLRVFAEHAKTMLHAASSDIYLYNATRDDLEMALSTSFSTVIGTRLRIGEGIAGRVAQSRQPLRVDDYSSWEGRSAKYQDVPYRAILEVPILYGGELIGVLTAVEFGDSKRQFTEADEHLLSLFASQAAGAIHAAKLHDETVRRLKHLQALRTIDESISGSTDISLILDVILDQIISELGVDAAIILLFDPAKRILEYVGGRGLYTQALQHTRLPLGESYAGRAALGRRMVQIPDLRTRHTDFLRSPTFSLEGFVSYFGVPLIANGEIVGVLEIFHRAPFEAETEWLNFLETLAGQTAIAIDIANLFKSLQTSNAELMLAYEDTIEGWSRALDLRDKETENHTQRVTKVTLDLARAMGVSESELVHVRYGALLHDIGKMGVSDNILLKPGKLTDEEWVIMRQHPVYAFEMLSPIAYLKPALDIPYCHHEKWDGTGYPRGLMGEQIPLAARIFAIVDVWDALISDRPYRKAWDSIKTFEYIREQSGRHFDPKVVEAFLKLFDQSSTG